MLTTYNLVVLTAVLVSSASSTGTGAVSDGAWAAVAKWRGMHGSGVGDGETVGLSKTNSFR